MAVRTREHADLPSTIHPKILEAILEEAGLTDSTKLSLSGTYADREYVVQYRESTLNFFQRLCEEVGIFYYFSHTEEETRLYLADDIKQLPDAPEPLLMSLGPTGGFALPLSSLTRQASPRTSTVNASRTST